MANEPGKLEPPRLFGRKRSGTEKKPAEAPEPSKKPARPPARPRRPVTVNGHLAALSAGVVSGGVLVGLIWLASTLDGSSDSNRVAFGLLVAIFVLAVVAGAAVLHALRVPSQGTIAFLATALVAVVAVVALGQHMDDLTGAVAGLVLSLVAYPAARLVTLRYIDAA